MPEGAHLLDIGANVGMYTIYAGVRGIRVTAFEPEAQNYALLCKNIRANEIDATAYCIALSDEQAVSKLYIAASGVGSSCNTFGESIDHNLKPRADNIRQGCVSFRLDDVSAGADYIKIDVDGLEHKVIAGGQETIRNAKSVLVEINTSLPQHLELIERMTEWGFTFDQQQVQKARRAEGPFSGCGNYIFTR
jgi:FkbM family methyltransferase